MDNRQGASDLLVDEVFDRIKRHIVTQTYKPGEKLTVRRLREEFGTSETPVKQALNRLIAYGLIEATPHKGMRVRAFDFQDLKNIMDARLMIEQYTLGAAIDRVRRDEAFVTHFCALVDDSEKAIAFCIANRSPESFDACSPKDSAIHRALVGCCENSNILSMYDNLNTHLSMYLGFEAHTNERLQTVINEHAQIRDNLLLCDTEGLKRAVERHVYGTVAMYRSLQLG